MNMKNGDLRRMEYMDDYLEASVVCLAIHKYYELQKKKGARRFQKPILQKSFVDNGHVHILWLLELTCKGKYKYWRDDFYRGINFNSGILNS